MTGWMWLGSMYDVLCADGERGVSAMGGSCKWLTGSCWLVQSLGVIEATTACPDQVWR